MDSMSKVFVPEGRTITFDIESIEAMEL